MATFGGNHFDGDFSVPLAFDGRYFILEPGDPPLVTVVREVDGSPTFEVLKNEPVGDDATKTPAGIVTVGESGGGFLYKVRPASETSVVFGTVSGDEIDVRITDKQIRVGGITLENNTFSGRMAGVVVDADGGVGIGAPIPETLVRWFGTS